jgi:ArsR family transcriptional regulator
MRILVQADLVTAKRIKQWIFYRRNEPAIARLKQAFTSTV